MKTKKQINSKGFSLIELLVVIAIIGVLAFLVIANVNSSREKAKVARARSDLKQLATAIDLLLDDTGEHPNHFSVDPCVDATPNNEVFLNTCEAGIQCDDAFPGWDGPYIGIVPEDPWGNNYLFDTDYTCHDYVPGCEDVPDGTEVRAILSFGQNGVGINVYDEPDNQVLILCSE